MNDLSYTQMCLKDQGHFDTWTRSRPSKYKPHIERPTSSEPPAHIWEYICFLFNPRNHPLQNTDPVWTGLNVMLMLTHSIRLNCRRYRFYFLNVFEPECFSFDLPYQTIRKQFIRLSLQSLCLYLERLAKRQIRSCCVWQLDVIDHLPL